MPVGLSPQSGNEVNATIGTHMRQFTDVKESTAHDYEWLLGQDLTAAPYNMTPDDETLIKSAVGGLHTALDGVDMTFINRLTGLF